MQNSKITRKVVILLYTQNDNSCVNFIKYAILRISLANKKG